MFLRNKTEDKKGALEVFTIFDSKSGGYDVPAFAQNKNVLMRDIVNLFNDPSQSRNKFLVNAEDYSIFKIGWYDKSTGQIESHNLEHVANMHDLRAMATPPAQNLGIVPT